MGVTEFIPTDAFSIPLGQVVSYMLLNTLCFFFNKHKLGLLINFIYIFNWGFLYGAANFVGPTGTPTMSFFVYLASGLMMVVIAVMGFFREA